MVGTAAVVVVEGGGRGGREDNIPERGNEENDAHNGERESCSMAPSDLLHLLWLMVSSNAGVGVARVEKGGEVGEFHSVCTRVFLLEDSSRHFSSSSSSSSSSSFSLSFSFSSSSSTVSSSRVVSGTLSISSPPIICVSTSNFSRGSTSSSSCTRTG